MQARHCASQATDSVSVCYLTITKLENCYEISSGQLGFQFELVRARKSATEDEVHLKAACK